MKEIIQQYIKKSNREELDEFYNYIKSGDLLEFVQGEIIFRNDISLKQQQINIGDCFIRQINDEYHLCRIDMILEKESNYVDCTRLNVDIGGMLDTWETEINKSELLNNWKSFDSIKFNQITELIKSANNQIADINKLTLEMILKLINDENT